MIEKIVSIAAGVVAVAGGVYAGLRWSKKRVRPSIDVKPCGKPGDRWLEIKNTSSTPAFNLRLSIDNFDNRAYLDEPGFFPVRELPSGRTLEIRYEGYEELSSAPRNVIVTYENKRGQRYRFDEPLQLV